MLICIFKGKLLQITPSYAVVYIEYIELYILKYNKVNICIVFVLVFLLQFSLSLRVFVAVRYINLFYVTNIRFNN